MRFKNVKASELNGPVDLPGLAEWIEGLTGDEAALLITAPAGTGKTAAVGAIARRLQRDVMQCDLLQVFDYPESRETLRSTLAVAESQRDVVFHMDGLDRAQERFEKAKEPRALDELGRWLRGRRTQLRAHRVLVVATARKPGAVPEELRAQFDSVFSAG